MKIILALTALLYSSVSYANCLTNRVGSYSYTNCSDGSSETSNRIGNYNYVRGRNSDGHSYSGTETNIGNSTWSNVNRNPSQPSYQAPRIEANPYRTRPYNPYSGYGSRGYGGYGSDD
jgi:hypothetical protein